MYEHKQYTHNTGAKTENSEIVVPNPSDASIDAFLELERRGKRARKHSIEMGNKHTANVQRMMAMQQGAYGAMSNPMYQGTNMYSRTPWANQPFGYNQPMMMPGYGSQMGYPSYSNAYSGNMMNGMYGMGYPFQSGAAGIAGGQTYVEQVNPNMGTQTAKAASF